MPIFEFKCKCGKKLEKFVKKPIKTTKCPSCNRRMTRIISPTNFKLKGPGWAKDSYGLKEDKKSNKPEAYK